MMVSVPDTLAVVPILIGPLSTLIALLPVILLALAGALLRLCSPAGSKKLALFFWHQKLFSCGLAAVVWFVFWGPRLHLWPRKLSSVSAAGASGEWNAFRGGPARRGAAPGGEDPTLAGSIWAYTRDKQIFGSPTIVGDRVYITTVVSMSQFSTQGAIVCLNAATGEEIWRYAPGNYRATFSSPAVYGDCLVCGEGLHWNTDARIVCLDLKNDGKLLWEFRTLGHLESSPTIYKDKVYIGAGMDGYYCVSLKPGADGTPVVHWHLNPSKYKDCESAPLVVDDVVYVGVGGERRSSPGAILALTADEGEELWRVNTPYPVFTPPSLAEGKLYIGMGIGDFVKDAEEIRKDQAEEMRKAGRSAEEIAVMEKETVPAGEVWCIDVKTHQCDWKYAVGRAVLGAVVPGAASVYFGSRDGNFYAVSKAGKPIAKFNAHEPIVTSPALGKEHVYFATMSGHFYCLRADSLELVWDMALGSGTGFLSSPALAQNHIYIGTANDGLRCIGRVGEKQPPIWRSGERGGAVDTSFLPPKLDLGWRYPKDPAAHFAPTAPLLPHGGFVYAAGINDGRAELVKLKPDLDKLDDAGRRAWTFPSTLQIALPPAAVGEELYVADGVKGDAGRALQCLAAPDARVNWRFGIASGASGCFTLDRKHLFIWKDADRVACLDRVSGKTVWASAKSLGDGVGAPALADGLVVLASNSRLHVLDDETGTPLLTAELSDPPAFSPAVWENYAVLATAKGVELRSLTDGSVQWASPIGSCATPPVVAGEKVAVITNSSELVVLNLSDGKVLSKIPQANPAMPPLPIADNIIYRDATDLSLLDASTGKSSHWYAANWLGEPRSPLVLLGQQLYFGTASKGIVCLRPKKQ